jgi:hypothetical protein
MAAPTGVSSGSAPEPVTPEPAATERLAAEPQAPTAEPQTLMVPEPAVPELAAPDPVVPELAVPEPAEPVADERAVTDPDPEPPAAGSAEHPGQARRTSRLVAAMVIIVVLAAAAAAGALAVVTHGFRPKTVVSYRPAAVFALRAGDCIDSSPNGLSVTVLSCASPHHAEVFATFSLAGSSWPGSAAVQQQVASGCQNKIAGYLNPALLNAGLTQEYIYPDQTAWKAGVRTAICEVSSSTGPLTGSVRSAS